MSTKNRNIEDTYPLSPMQEGMLFHSLYAPDSGVYVTQVTCTLGNLHVPALEQAWQQVVDRHPILRTAFVWKNLDKPIQVVGRRVGMPLEQYDWRHLSASEQEERFQDYLREDRKRGFPLSHAPLMRLALFQLAEDTYKFAWSHHHLLLDGWSLPLVLREVFTFYEALCRGQELHLERSRPYRDYIAWLGRQDLSEAEAFWRRTLRGFTAPTSLGVDHAPGGLLESAAEYAEQQIWLSAEMTVALQSLARQQQLTLNTLVQGAWALLLGRYSGQEDVVFGSVVSGRPADLPGVETMIGPFINTLPVRAQVGREARLLEWLKQLQAHQAEMRWYEYSPLVQIQGWSEVPRGVPLFESILAFENYPVETVFRDREENASLHIQDIRHREQTNYPLTVIAGPGQHVSVRVLYDGRHYEGATVKRLLGHMQTLLEGMVADPEVSISRLPLLTEAERQQLLVEWNETQMNYPPHTCIHHLFETQARKTPEAVAVVCEDAHLTYRELNRQANHLAHDLQGLGVGPEVRVGICLERSVAMLVGMLGILKAGGAYVPLDPAYPPERVAFMLEDSQVAVLLTQTHLLDRLPDHQAPVVCLDQWLVNGSMGQRVNDSIDSLTHFPIASFDSNVLADNLAYMIYTSGSTGQPKGVAIAHRSAVVLLHWAREVFELEDWAGVLAATSICFDLSVFELFVPLSWGGTVVLAEHALRLPELQAAARVTLINTVPSAMAELVKMNGVSASVRTVNLAGEPLPTTLVQQIYELGTVRRVYDLYGPSEDTTYSTFALRSGDGPATIGRPIANTQVYVLDENLEPVPVGVAGEVYIGGAGLARGYWNRPELTAEKFVPSPFAGKSQISNSKFQTNSNDSNQQIPNGLEFGAWDLEFPSVRGERLYRTGDLARYRADGNIEFLGRMDHQVKVRGFRIELGEIEAVLSQHESVQQAVVVMREDEPGDKRLVAYVVPKPVAQWVNGSMGQWVNEAIDSLTHLSVDLHRELRQHVKAKLPEYMAPAAYVTLDAFPLTPNGKVDRRALPAPESSRSEVAGVLVAARNPVEALLAEMWAQVLGVEQVGVQDHFFELGGHSLLATRLLSRLRDAFQVELPLASLFEAPVLADLAQRIERAQKEAHGLSLPPLEPVRRDGALPLSFAQQRLWFLDQLSPGDVSYTIPAAIRLEGHLDVMALQRSLNEIARRHETLRTTFANVRGRPVQVIHPAQGVEMPVVDLRVFAEDEREAELEGLAREEARRPFDLARGPLWRVTLVQLEAEQHALLLSLHHIISDGWSMEVLIREVSTLYEAFRQGRPSPLPALPVQYADYAHWQRQWLQGEVLEQQLRHWKEQLRGSPSVLALPTDRPRPAAPTYRGAIQTLRLSRELSRGLRELSRREGVTLFMTLLAAWQTLLYRYSGQNDILVGTPIAGRTNWAIEELIGFFVNTLVLRANFEGEPRFRELLRQVRRVCLEAYAHQEVPFEQVVEVVQPERNLSHTPLFQVMFAWQNAGAPKLELPGLRLGRLKTGTGAAQFDLTLTLVEEPDGLSGRLEYNTDLFDDSTIARMLTHYENLLTGVVADPEQRVSNIRLLTEAERRQVLVEWNDTKREWENERMGDTAASLPLSHSPTLPSLFEAQVERSPEAVAVVYEDEHLTYRELNWRANQLAYDLQTLGVGPEVLVGLCLERSLEMVIGLLGVLKAGGAYVPLDPGYPVERLAFMVEDSRASVLLTQTHWLKSLPACQAPVICLDQWLIQNPKSKIQNLDSGVMPDNLAYVIYTSGSTGQPKGVVISHRAIYNHMLWMQTEFPLTQADAVLQKTPFSFDASIWEFYAPLLAGARLIMARPGGHQDTAYLVKAIAQHNVTILQLVPTLLRVLLNESELETCHSLRRVFCGGEALPVELQQRFYARLDADLTNLYGPTEAAIDTVFWTCERTSQRRTVPIGHPVANTQLYVLDSAMQPVPVGVAGELHIGGDSLGRGYLHRPDLTAEKFIPNPFVKTKDQVEEEGLGSWALGLGSYGARLYKTGDLARYLPDGSIEFLGRLDHQVKFRGFRIELGEIEAVLSQHPAVREAVVVAREDGPGSSRLVAYLVAQPVDQWVNESTGQQVDETTSQRVNESMGSLTHFPISPLTPQTHLPVDLHRELREFLRAKVPDYMAPSAFVLMEALPLTPNGKVDRQALPAPDCLRPEVEFVAPRTPTEAALAEIWAHLLGVDRIGVNDRFFDLGGHSLLATQLVSQVRETFGVELPLRRLFETPTVAALADAISQTQLSGEKPDGSKIERRQRGEQSLEELVAELEQLSAEEAQALLAG